MSGKNWIPREESDHYHDKNIKTLENFLKDLDGAIHPLENFKKLKGNKRNKRKFNKE